MTSAYPLIKQLLVDRLTDRGGLAGVVVSYSLPENVPDLVGSTGRYEGVYLDTAEGALDVQIFTDRAAHHWAEDYEQQIVVQVIRQESTGSQRAVDDRCAEIAAEVLAEIGSAAFRTAAEDYLSAFDYIIVTPQSQRWVTGHTNTSGGHGAACELGLRVEARRSY